MGGAIAKFVHPFNGPMQYAGRGIVAAHNGSYSGYNNLYGVKYTNMNMQMTDSQYKSDVDPGRFYLGRVRPQVGTGNPISGKASVDGLGNLSFKGGGYTYLIRMPNDDETGFQNKETSIKIVDIVTTLLPENENGTTKYFYNDRLYYTNEVSYSGDYFYDKNNGPAWYIHTDRKLKKGKHLMIIGMTYKEGSNYIGDSFGFTNWYDV